MTSVVVSLSCLETGTGVLSRWREWWLEPELLDEIRLTLPDLADERDRLPGEAENEHSDGERPLFLLGEIG